MILSRDYFVRHNSIGISGIIVFAVGWPGRTQPVEESAHGWDIIITCHSWHATAFRHQLHVNRRNPNIYVFQAVFIPEMFVLRCSIPVN